MKRQHLIFGKISSILPILNIDAAYVNTWKIWGHGGMVDTTDLKSVGRQGCEGSSPSAPNFIIYSLTFYS